MVRDSLKKRVEIKLLYLKGEQTRPEKKLY